MVLLLSIARTVSIGLFLFVVGCKEKEIEKREGQPFNGDSKFEFLSTCKEGNCKLEIVRGKDALKPLITDLPSMPEIKQAGMFFLATISCGNPCTATYILNSESGNSFGPLSDVLHLEPNQMSVAWLDGSRVVVTDLKTGDKSIEFGLSELAPAAAPVSAIESTWSAQGHYWVRYLKGNEFEPVTVQITQPKSESPRWKLDYRANTQSSPFLVDLDANGQLDTVRIVSFAGRPPTPYQVSNPFGWNPRIPESNRLAIEVVLTGASGVKHLLTDSSLFSTPIYDDSSQWSSAIRAGTASVSGAQKGVILVGTETGADLQLWYQDGKFHIAGPQDGD
jgi:hypothetical protein